MEQDELNRKEEKTRTGIAIELQVEGVSITYMLGTDIDPL
jgi:hypothetical protein